MKKFTIILSVIGLLLAFTPMNVSATEEINKRGTIYGDIYIDATPPTSSSPKSVKKFSITKTNSAGYVYIYLLPVSNISSISIVYTSSVFEKVSETKNSDGSIYAILKTKDGSVINGTKTELLTAYGDVEGDVGDGCEFSYNLLTLVCAAVDGNYYDDNGKPISKTEYDEICDGKTPTNPDTPNDVPNSDTGSVIPYIAIGGGIVAIAGVYLYSRKTSKFYKL